MLDRPDERTLTLKCQGGPGSAPSILTGADVLPDMITVKVVFACTFARHLYGCGCPAVTDGLDSDHCSGERMPGARRTAGRLLQARHRRGNDGDRWGSVLGNRCAAARRRRAFVRRTRRNAAAWQRRDPRLARPLQRASLVRSSSLGSSRLALGVHDLAVTNGAPEACP